MSDAITLFQLRPFLVAFAAARFLGDSMNTQQYISAGRSMRVFCMSNLESIRLMPYLWHTPVIAFAGEILIARPSFLFFNSPIRDIIKSGPDSIAHSSTFDRSISIIILLFCVSTSMVEAVALQKVGKKVSPMLLLGVWSGVSIVASAM